MAWTFIDLDPAPMLSDYQIRKMGLTPIDGPKDDHRRRYRFHADLTDLRLVTDPCTGFYELWSNVPLGGKLWQGPLHEPKSLIRKLIFYGNNAEADPEADPE